MKTVKISIGFLKYLLITFLISSCSVFYKNTPIKNTEWELISIFDSTTGKTAVFPKDNPIFFTFKESNVKIFHFWRFKNIISCYDGWLIIETNTQRNKKFQEYDWIEYDISTKYRDSIQLKWHYHHYMPHKDYSGSLNHYNTELSDALLKMMVGAGSYEIKDSQLIIHIGYNLRHHNKEEPVKLVCILKSVSN